MFNEFPYTDLHNLNLDWFLSKFKALETAFTNLKNSISAMPDATDAQAGQVPTADGDGHWVWQDPVGGSSDSRPHFEKSLIATARNTICGDDDHYMQGGCYVESTGHFVIAFSPIDISVDNTTALIELDTDFATVINTVSGINYGHCNDLTYNPNTDLIYASSTGHVAGSAYTGKVIKINPSTLAITGTVDNITNLVSAISYDPVNDVYYTIETSNGTRIARKYDAGFTLLSELGPAYIIDANSQTGQCSFCLDGVFYYVTVSNAYGHKVWINTFGSDPQVWEQDNFAYYETENVMEINGKLYMGSIKTTNYIYFHELSTDGYIHNYENELYMRGTVIRKNTSLTALTQTGRYYETATSAGTITGAPYTMDDEFTVDVIHLGYDNIMQVLTDSYGHIYTRVYNGSWTTWQKLDGHMLHTGSDITDTELDNMTSESHYVGYLNASTYFNGSFWCEVETVHLTASTARYLQIVRTGSFIAVRTMVDTWGAWAILKEYSNATTSAAGLMSAADKANLDAVYADYTAMLNLI